ncbi:hypothetical protein JXB22_04390 [candidate division WOR-3 bacterium]|nr:hypothetical protein [candidate division WOR-3 bacterium]
MLLLLLLVSYDSLPPLPDLSQITFPEPPLWIHESDNIIHVTGGAGEFVFANGEIRFQDLAASGGYTDRLNWGNARYGKGTLSYTHGFPHLWIQPVLDGFSMKRDDEYFCITPGFNFATTNPWSVMRGLFGYTVWDINSFRFIEASTRFDIIVDRIVNKPHLSLQGIFTNDRFYQLFGGGVHIRDFHIMAISPVTDFFPSPCVSIASLHPSYRIISEIRTGAVLKPLSDRFDPSLPLHYTSAAPIESLRIAAHIGISFDLYDHTFEMRADYRNWYNRSVPAADFLLKETPDIQEVNVGLRVRNTIDQTHLHIRHTVYGCYSWSDSILPFRPRYTVLDTLGFEYRFIFAEIAFEYRAAHRGISTGLPSSLLVDPRIGVCYRVVTLFIAVKNSTGTQREYYDGYWTSARAFTGGVRFKTAF